MTQDDILDALLPLVPRLGWTHAALARAAGDAAATPKGGDAAATPKGGAAAWAENAFPRGPRDAIAHWSRRCDAALADTVLDGLRTPGRIRALIVARLGMAAPHKEALRQALAMLAAPWNAPLAAKLTAETVSAMWYAAGDTSADFSWYTRRATLAAVYGTTLAFWMTDASDDMAPTLAFLDRRLEGLAKLNRKPRAA